MPISVLEHARGVADAVLYEGYLLYPYRRSSGKNRVRWQFGVLAPRKWIEARGPMVDGVAGSAESWWQQAEVLLEPTGRSRKEPAGELTVRLRFLQLQDKTVERRRSDGRYEPVGQLDVDGTRHLSFGEAVPHEIDLVFDLADSAAGSRGVPVAVAGADETDPVLDAVGREAARVRRTRSPLAATVRLAAERCATPFPLLRLRVRVENAVSACPPGASRDEALRQALVATHVLMAAPVGGGEVDGDAGMRFVSLLEPPEWAAEAARSCHNVRSFPVLVGEPGSTGAVLCSPIILYDHPQIAPESPGDLHDAAEIDEILSLRTRTLSDEEKREVRATDARAAAILDRVEGMPPEVLERLHGAVRSLRPGGGNDPRPAGGNDAAPDGPAWWQPGADERVRPERDVVLVNGVRVGRGSRVRLRPRTRGSDAHDMFLAGRIARVEKVLLDVDGSRFLAVAVEDDPGLDLHPGYERFRHFRPDEVQPLPGAAGSAAGEEVLWR